MEIINEIKNLRDKIKKYKKDDLKIGFVPTMGYLHKGHQSLIKRAREENGIVVVSIFVNPTQFGENEDFDKYPKDLQRDINLCEKSGTDIVFIPEIREIYPEKSFTEISVNIISNGLCGMSRPTHFNGVCLVVNKLFNIVTPDRAYFGEKDYQQLLIIKRMVIDLNVDIDIVSCPIIREEDGLAMSSRNSYLSLEERRNATILYRSLLKAKEIIINGEKSVYKIKEIINKMIKEEIKLINGAKIDYIEIVDLKKLEKVEKVESGVLIALAVFIGKTRLIDNIVVDLKFLS